MTPLIPRPMPPAPPATMSRPPHRILNRQEARRPARAAAYATLALLVLLGPMTPPPAGADGTTLTSAHLPTGRYGTAAVWDGTNAYVFGGWKDTGTADEVVRFNPVTNAVQVMGARFPGNWAEGGAVWTGSYALLFGGVHPFYPEIMKYTPATDSLVSMPGTYTPRFEFSAVWTGTYAFIFGGYNPYYDVFPTGYLDQIVRYNPANGEVKIMDAKLPSPRSETSAIWDGTHAYIFNGYRSSGGFTNEILKYDPVLDTISVTAYTPVHQWSTAAVWDGANAYLLGGTLQYITKFVPATNTASLMAGTVRHDSTRQASAVWANGKAYLFGGWGDSGRRLDDILVYDQTLSSRPQSVTAATGPGGGQITLNWQAPASTGGTPILNYRVYRSTAEHGTYTLAGTVGNVLTYADSGLGNGATYYYRVAPVTANGEGSWSFYPVSATTFTLPDSPVGTQATAGPAIGQITVTWNPPSNTGGTPITNYKVYRATSFGGPYGLVATVGNVLTYTDSGLSNGVTYYYKVSAVTVAGEGPQGSWDDATTFAAPGAPTNPRATAGPGAGEIQVAWNPPSSTGGSAITNYKVYRAASAAGPYSLIATVGNVLAYPDSGLADATTYHYKISAVNGVGTGPQSAAASATTFATPGAPQNLAANVGPGLGQVTLEWDPPASNGGGPITSYNIYRAKNLGALVLIDSVTAPGYVDNGRQLGEVDQYVVRAVNAVGQGAASNKATTLGTGLPA